MLSPTWLEDLQQWTARQNRLPRIAVLGIGNVLRADDAAGVLVARRLLQSALGRDSDAFLVIDAGHAPENTTAELRRFGPECVILIDATELGQVPGAVRWVGIHEIDGMSASTHTLPLSLLARYLIIELGCEVRILGIQPQAVEIGEAVSEAILQAVYEISDGLVNTLLGRNSISWDRPVLRIDIPSHSGIIRHARGTFTRTRQPAS